MPQQCNHLQHQKLVIQIIFLTRLNGIGTVISKCGDEGGVGCTALMDFRQAPSRQCPACPCASLAMMTTAGKLA
jgi:hypothetical protein